VPEPADNESYTYNAVQVSAEPKEEDAKKTLVQQDKVKSSDPICSSANWPCNTQPENKPSYPVDYKVANFGVDEDIKNTQEHIKQQEKKHGAWTPKQDANGNWEVPEPINNKAYSYGSLVQTDADVKVGSDPICHSAGCPKSKWFFKTEAEVVQYPNPLRYGYERDIVDSFADEKVASSSLNHEWDFNRSIADIKAASKALNTKANA
jgi:hypothetical protein